MRAIRIIRQYTQKLTFAAGLIAVTMLSMGFMAVTVPKAGASGFCDAVNIVKCGIPGSTVQELINSTKSLYTSGKDGYGNTDIKTIMQWGKYTDSIVAGMNTTNTKKGTLYKNGDIIVDGRVVGKDTWVAARSKFGMTSGFVNVSGNVYARATTTYFESASVPVLVTFNSDGNAIAAIMEHCGNPVRFTQVPKPISFKCVNLVATISDRSRNEYTFTATGSSTNITLASGIFSFGDGSVTNAIPANSATTVVTKHAYAKGGPYTAKVILTFKNSTTNETSVCQTSFTVAVPYGECVQLSGPAIDASMFSYKFVATMKYGNGAKFESADFDFGDGTKATGVKATDTTSVSVDHTYAKAGNYSVTALLKFTVDGKALVPAAPVCRALVTPTTPPTPECKPGIPVGDIRCNPCPYDASVPADDKERCVAGATTTLPNTGAGNVIALAAGALIAGFMYHRHLMFRKHKAAFRAAELGTSPLPLAQPLATSHPLAGTPLASSRKQLFRRRRQF